MRYTGDTRDGGGGHTIYRGSREGGLLPIDRDGRLARLTEIGKMRSWRITEIGCRVHHGFWMWGRTSGAELSGESRVGQA